MVIIWVRLLSVLGGVLRPAFIVLVTIGISLGADKKGKQDLPIVNYAAVPFYPRDAQLAHIDGMVRLRISTDGETASRVELLEGPVALARAARDNVKTWRFGLHTRATFETTFRYTLLSGFVCVPENSTVLLRLPLEVEVTAKSVKTCDPAVEIKPK